MESASQRMANWHKQVEILTVLHGEVDEPVWDDSPMVSEEWFAAIVEDVRVDDLLEDDLGSNGPEHVILVELQPVLLFEARDFHDIGFVVFQWLRSDFRLVRFVNRVDRQMVYLIVCVVGLNDDLGWEGE